MQQRALQGKIDATVSTSPAQVTQSPSAVSRTSASDSSPVQLENLARSVESVVVEPSRQPRFLGQSSGITLAKMVMAAVRIDASTAPAPLGRVLHQSSTVPVTEASLPPKHAANHLLDVYFQYRTPHLPIFRRSLVEQAVINAYQQHDSTRDSTEAANKDIFITYMVFTIALFDVTIPSGGRSSQSEGCFRSAVTLVERVIHYSHSDLDTLRAVLLLAQFVALYPSRGSFWHLAGFALRLCVDIGLHWEQEELAERMSPEALYDRRSLWYCTYYFDPILGTTLGRPLGIIDESTRVPLPDPVGSTHGLDRSDGLAERCARAHNHLFARSKLQSEIRHVLHSQTWTPSLAYPRVDYAAWLQDIQPRLQYWYDTIPKTDQADPQSIFAHHAYWEVVYCNAVLLLHRPHSIAQHPSQRSLSMTFDASSKLISSIKTLQREGKIHILWQSVHELFMAGLGIIYCLWQSEEIRRQRSTSSSITTLNTCASTLAALSESFAGAAGCRDVFESLSAATVD